MGSQSPASLVMLRRDADAAVDAVLPQDLAGPGEALAMLALGKRRVGDTHCPFLCCVLMCETDGLERQAMSLRGSRLTATALSLATLVGSRPCPQRHLRGRQSAPQERGRAAT